MNCISLWQPFASAIQVGLKTIETRHWAPDAGAIGKPLAIAAAKKDTGELRAWWIEHVVRKPSNHAAFQRFGYNDWSDLPKGEIVCTTVLSGVVSTNDDPPGIPAPRPLPTDEEFGDFSENRFAWFLTDVVPLKQTIPVVGRQGFFTVNL